MAIIVAVHYRDKNDLNNTVQGHYKEFSSREAADSWLQWRCKKTKDSPKGQMIFVGIDGICFVLQNEKEYPQSLVKALKKYLEFKGIKMIPFV